VFVTNFTPDLQVLEELGGLILESREPGPPILALFSQGGEEKSLYFPTLSLTCKYYLMPALRLSHDYTMMNDSVNISQLKL
jgi:hypothetical protein